VSGGLVSIGPLVLFAPPLKHTQRLDIARLAGILGERNLVEEEVLKGLLEASQTGAQPFCEALVQGGFLSDWDLGRVVSEVFQLAFIPTEQLKPDPALLEVFDADFLMQQGLVPVHRFGEVVTVAMPGLVPADALAMLGAATDLVVLPVVGTVQGNRAWLDEHLRPDMSSDSRWGNLFDEGEANVQRAIDGVEAPLPARGEAGQARTSAGSLMGQEGEAACDLPPAPTFEPETREA
jgi:hypothetical protein